MARVAYFSQNLSELAWKILKTPTSERIILPIYFEGKFLKEVVSTSENYFSSSSERSGQTRSRNNDCFWKIKIKNCQSEETLKIYISSKERIHRCWWRMLLSPSLCYTTYVTKITFYLFWHCNNNLEVYLQCQNSLPIVWDMQ